MGGRVAEKKKELIPLLGGILGWVAGVGKDIGDEGYVA